MLDLENIRHRTKTRQAALKDRLTREAEEQREKDKTNATFANCKIHDAVLRAANNGLYEISVCLIRFDYNEAVWRMVQQAWPGYIMGMVNRPEEDTTFTISWKE